MTASIHPINGHGAPKNHPDVGRVVQIHTDAGPRLYKVTRSLRRKVIVEPLTEDELAFLREDQAKRQWAHWIAYGFATLGQVAAVVAAHTIVSQSGWWKLWHADALQAREIAAANPLPEVTTCE